VLFTDRFILGRISSVSKPYNGNKIFVNILYMLFCRQRNVSTRKLYRIFALAQSISRIMIYSSKVCDSVWNTTPLFTETLSTDIYPIIPLCGSRLHSHIQLIFSTSQLFIHAFQKIEILLQNNEISIADIS
jgi:hypothetical protein